MPHSWFRENEVAIFSNFWFVTRGVKTSNSKLFRSQFWFPVKTIPFLGFYVTLVACVLKPGWARYSLCRNKATWLAWPKIGQKNDALCHSSVYYNILVLFLYADLASGPISINPTFHLGFSGLKLGKLIWSLFVLYRSIADSRCKQKNWDALLPI